MAAGIAHEINNPLAVIVSRAGMLIELAEKNKLSPEAVMIAAKSIESTSLRISKTVRALRAFARDGENDPLELVEVRSLLVDTLELCRERFKSKGIDLRIDAPPAHLVVRCRPIQITQVLLNLLNNAFDAVSDLESDKWAALSVLEQDGSCEISVSNGGPLIPPELRERLMLPFFTTKPAGHATGLGLSVSQRILHSHESVLELDADAPHTRFRFRLRNQ